MSPAFVCPRFCGHVSRRGRVSPRHEVVLQQVVSEAFCCGFVPSLSLPPSMPEKPGLFASLFSANHLKRMPPPHYYICMPRINCSHARPPTLVVMRNTPCVHHTTQR